MKRKFLISIIIPVYNEEKQITLTVNKINKIMLRNLFQYEMILIDDGSNDNSWEEIKSLSDKNPKINGIQLSRNFGKESAICAGIESISGDAVIIIDVDLQHPLDIIPKMVRIWQEEGYDIVEGVKKSNTNRNIFKKIGSKMFYYFFNKMCGFNLSNASDFKLMDSKVIEAWKEMPEKNTFFRGMSAWLGFRRKEIPVVVNKRKIGKSKWSINKLIMLTVSALSSFSSIPLFLIAIVGLIFFIAGFFLGIQALYLKFSGIATSGFTTVILLQLIIGSILMFGLGIIGIYIAKIYNEVKNRPRYLIKEIIRRRIKKK